jgi:TolB-like protein/DNA-binding SARP family transcriptional activator
LALLKLFGGASLETEAGPLHGPAAQRRRLGLLARLALAGSQGLSRDKLIAYLWPESDTDKARHLLSDSIYRINQSLGGEILVGWGDQLRIDFARLRCDVIEFESALERGEPEAAVRLYRGPFLDGFFLDEALELERWVEGERERLAHRYAGAMESLAEGAESRGDHLEAARHWRSLAAHDPLGSRVALRLVKALMATGDRAAALQRARAHEALLRAEWGAAPADEFSRAVAELSVETAGPAPAVRRYDGTAVANTPTAVPSGGGAEAVGTVLPPFRRVAALLAVAAALLVVVVWRVGLAARTPDGPLAVAVLPFDDLSPGQDQAYLADGVTEELIGALAGVEGLRVSSRTSAFSLKGKSLDAKEVGQRLGVTRVIDGSLRREGSRVRIAVRLADARSGYQLWSTAFDREVAGMLATQEELARAIAGALRVRLGAGESVASPGSSVDDPAAYDLYLRGRYHWHRRTEADLRAAVAAFEEAVRRAPDYARAWAGLADAYAILGFYDWGRPSEFFPKAREAALRAREADELRGEAEATLGYVAFYHDWDWPAAEASFREAIRLEPRSSKAHQWYANFLTGMGRFMRCASAAGRWSWIRPSCSRASGAAGRGPASDAGTRRRAMRRARSGAPGAVPSRSRAWRTRPAAGGIARGQGRSSRSSASGHGSGTSRPTRSRRRRSARARRRRRSTGWSGRSRTGRTRWCFSRWIRSWRRSGGTIGSRSWCGRLGCPELSWSGPSTNITDCTGSLPVEQTPHRGALHLGYGASGSTRTLMQAGRPDARARFSAGPISSARSTCSP